MEAPDVQRHKNCSVSERGWRCGSEGVSDANKDRDRENGSYDAEPTEPLVEMINDGRFDRALSSLSAKSCRNSIQAAGP